MKRYLLDTNVISEVRKPKPHGAVLLWLRELRGEQAFLSAVTMGELQRGIELTRRQDPVKAREIEIWVDKLENQYDILAMDAACFREYSRLVQRKHSHVVEDGMIAAIARVHDLTIATRNETDFRQFDVPLFNPFSVKP